MNKCTNCQTKTNLFFCPNCGQILEYPDFIKSEEKLKRSLEVFVKNLINASKKSETDLEILLDKSELSNAIYRKYYKHITYLQQLCSTEQSKIYFEGNGEALFEKMDQFAERCRKNECQIAVAGTIKAGKSMLINALLGKEIASTYPTPETASLTKFRSAEGADYIKISFYNSEEWSELWNSVLASKERSIRDDKEDFLSAYNNLNADSIKGNYINKDEIICYPQNFEELKQIVDTYTSARYAEHFFAKEVEVGLVDFDAPTNVVFVDTPGLNDPVSYRSDITRKYLHSANVVLWCTKATGPGDLDALALDSLAGLFAELRYAKENIFIFGTQIDVVTPFMEQWKEFTYPHFVTYLQKDIYFGSKKNTEEKIKPVTAWFYNLIQRAKKNPDIWKDKKEKKNLERMVRDCFDVPEREDLIEEYGLEEADKRHKTPKQVFYEHIAELEEMTGIPEARKAIMDGPVSNAENIIKKDIQGDYSYLCKQISNTATEISTFRLETIKQSNAVDLQEKILLLDQQIKQGAKEYTITRTALNETLELMQEHISTIISNFQK